MSDPVEFPGLAHFCEHMLFLGNAKVCNLCIMYIIIVLVCFWTIFLHIEFYQFYHQNYLVKYGIKLNGQEILRKLVSATSIKH